MKKVNIHEAKTHFSRLIEEVNAGEEIIISKAGKPVAKLVPLSDQDRPERKPGALKGKIWIAEDFDAPLPDDVLNSFYGSSVDEGSS